MTTTLWILQGVLAFVFLMAGIMKLMQPKEKVVASGGAWAADFEANHVKLIGAVELICAIGIIAPPLLHRGMHYITSTAAMGLVVLMAGAIYTHFKRKEYPFMALNLVFLLMAFYVGYYWCPVMNH